MDFAISINKVLVRLTTERWYHITVGHPEVADFYFEILETIESPDLVYEGSNYAKIAVKKLPGSVVKYLLVVYKETGAHDGFVITAYLSSREQVFKNKKLLWKQPS